MGKINIKRSIIYLAYITCGKPFLPATWRRPSSVLCMVTHLLGCAPAVVIDVIKASNSSFFSFSFFTNDSIALFANISDSPPCLWHIKLWTMLRQASFEDGVWTAMFVLLFDLNFDRHTRQTMAPRELSVVYLLSGELELPKMFMFRYSLNDINLLKIISIAIKYITPEVFLKSNTFIIIFILYIYMHPSNELTVHLQVEERTDLFWTWRHLLITWYSYSFACLPYLMRDIIHETNFQNMKMFPFYNSRFWFRLWRTYSRFSSTSLLFL